ncbi:MAG: hypothetical protein L6408_08885 [Nanoarchaeota archaeon]|nr:hypothetical protein [Nanoarchaeota archaeon]
MFKRFLEKFTARNTLYYPGCMTKFVLKDLEKNYMEILKKLDIEFIMLKDLEFCCGSPIINAGFPKDFNDLIDKNLEAFKNHGISRIITNCPGCYNILSNNYSNIKVEHMTQVIWKNIEKLNLKSFNEKITYHDPCHLGRHSDIYDEPRYIIKALDFELIESKRTKENTLCCGAGGGLRNNAPKIASKVAKLRFDDVATKKLITCCPMCYHHLKEHAPMGIEVLELSQVLL